MLSKKKNDSIPVTIGDNILTFAYYLRSVQHLNLLLRVTQPAIDFFVQLLFGHSLIGIIAWGLLNVNVNRVEKAVELQRDSWLSETRVNMNFHTGSRPAPSSQPGTFFPSDLTLEFLENWRGCIVSSSDVTAVSDTGWTASMRIGEEDLSAEVERYLSS